MNPFKKATIVAILTVLVALAAVPAMAQQNVRIPIGVDFKGDDNVGKSFVYSLEEQLNRSTIFQYDAEAGMYLKAVSTTVQPQFSAIAVALLLKQNGKPDEFLYEWVFIVGKDKADEGAKALLVDVNDLFNKAAAQSAGGAK